MAHGREMPTRHGMRRLKLHGTRRKPLGENHGGGIPTYISTNAAEDRGVCARRDSGERGGKRIARWREVRRAGRNRDSHRTHTSREDGHGRENGRRTVEEALGEAPPPPPLLEEEVEWRLSLPSEGKGAQNLHGKPVAGSHQKPTPPKFSTAACARFSDHSPFAEGFSQVETPVLAL